MINQYSKKGSAMLWIIIVAVIVIIAIVAIIYFSGLVTNTSTGSGGIIKSKDPLSVIKTKNSDIGNILTNNNGLTLYMFKADTDKKSNCYGACAVNWPPLLIDSEYYPTGEGTSGSLDTTLRTDGTTQVTINGMPLYTFIKDLDSEDIYGQGLNAAGGLWYVVSPSGQVITTAISSTNPTTPTTPTTSAPQTYNLDIRNFAFSSKTLTIKKGDKVIWENYDTVKHTVTSDSGSELSSQYLGTNEEYSHTFNNIGTFDYHCIPHPNMKATIIVK